MTYPETLKIGAHEYELIFAPHWEGSDDGDLGQTNYERHQIHIKTGLPDTTTLSTVIHEILHVMNSQLDHVFLESISEQLTQVLWDNGFIEEE
ncbi:hypothetical protein C4568_03605 [Candidatus Parcubacteria bacterium]|nr:MAG: hypothetical protein C4568_03605 [Candidatus Parcubacteria bacterium]